jgi:formylglycine-generating enzyme required for sulfatase activity
MSLRTITLAAVTSSALACSAREPEQLPPLGEVVVSIDTDAAVPQMVGRLRVDVFDDSGRWLDSRDVARTDAKDWPASFSVFTADENTSRTVLVRARAYLEGRVRDYQGERFQERAPYVEPPVASTLEELCEKAPELVLGEELTLRRGSRTITGLIPDQIPPGAPDDYQPACAWQTVGGAVAATLNVRTAGEYRIETTRFQAAFSDPTLFIRSDCRDAATQIACNDDLDNQDVLVFDPRSRLVLNLEPGSYTVLSASLSETPSDVTLRADLAANWKEPAPTRKQPMTGSAPRLIVDGEDRTPSNEPEPLVTIDRLARITVVPGEKRETTLLLRTVCGGQMAKLSALGSDSAPVLAEAETCVDREGERQAVPEEPTALAAANRRAATNRVGSFPQGSPCPAASSGQVSCIPSGSFLLGTPAYAPYPLSTTPERFAVMSRFWLDTTEVTVGRYRAAVARGFSGSNDTPIANDDVLDLQLDQDYEYFRRCTFSVNPSPGGENRESHPLNCIDWYTARAFCQFEGGDLPSEAQWQYAASKAGRSAELDETCAGCDVKSSLPLAVDDPLLAGDVTPLGVRGLFGNLEEWALDSFQPLDSACWNAATLSDPLCWEVNAPERTLVGSNFDTNTSAWRTGGAPSGTRLLQRFPAALGFFATGFRCVYWEQP